MAQSKQGDPSLPTGPVGDLVKLFARLQATHGAKTIGQIRDATGYARGFIWEVLKGRARPSPDKAVGIARALGATEPEAAQAFQLAQKIASVKAEERGERKHPGSHHVVVTEVLRAWDALDPDIGQRGQAPGSPLRQALEAALARAITAYADDDGRLDICGPLLPGAGLLAEPDVAAELAKVTAGREEANAELIGHRWRIALTEPTSTRDFAIEAAALLEHFKAQVTSGEFGPWLRGDDAGRPAALAKACTAARGDLANAAELAGTVTVGPLAPGLRMHLLDQTSVIAGHVSGFVGRERILDQIDDVVKTRDSAYCHVLAHPGVGKTALMARLVRDGNYIHHFNIRTRGVVSPKAFLGNICARLIARYQLRAEPRENAYEDGSYLSELLHEAALRCGNQKVVIVADALDESDTSLLLTGTNPLFLPSALPRGVIIVVASRPERETRPVREWRPVTVNAECEQVVIGIDHLGEDNMADIRAYLESWSAKEGIAGYMSRFGYDAAAFVEELACLSEGNFMYLRHVLPAIDSGQLNDRELASLPLGLLAYYDDHLERMKDEDLGLWYRYRLPVIGAFVRLSSRPLTVTAIAAMTGIEEGIVWDTLRRWSAFVAAEPVPGSNRLLAYRIYHASFAEYLGASTQPGHRERDRG